MFVRSGARDLGLPHGRPAQLVRPFLVDSFHLHPRSVGSRAGLNRISEFQLKPTPIHRLLPLLL